MKTKLIIAAGTGFLGQVLVNHFKDKYDQILILTRGKSKINNHIKYVNWDAKTFSGWEIELENADVLIKFGRQICRLSLFASQ